jgi:hypothetical protein
LRWKVNSDVGPVRHAILGHMPRHLPTF